MIRISLLWLVVALAALPSAAQENILFQRDLLINSSANNFDATQFDLDLTFLDNQLFPTDVVRLFDDVVISESSVGMTFETTALDGLIFSTVVDRLTDAANEFIRVELTEDEAGGLSEQRGWQESLFFLNGEPSMAPGQADGTINRFSLKVMSFDLSPTGSSGPNAPVNLMLEFAIFGTPIPEPSTGCLFACGLAMLGPLLFSRRRHSILVKAVAPRRKR